jgi:hypothetical protein
VRRDLGLGELPHDVAKRVLFVGHFEVGRHADRS